MTEPSASRPRTRTRPRISRVVAVTAVILLALVALGTYVASSLRASDEITIGLIAEPQDLDVRNTAGAPLDQILIDNVYQGLVGLSSGSVDEIVPVLASKMPEVDDDGLGYTFTLRKGVSFHSGAPLTAADVVASLNVSLTPDVLGTGAQVSAMTGEDGTEQVRITLDSPNNQLLWHLANRPGLILNSGADNLTRTANGTGPYMLDTWDRGNRLTLEANEDYWGDPATLDHVHFRFISDGRAIVNALRSGELDVHTALLPSLRKEFEGDDAFTLTRARGTDVFTLAFNEDHAPLDDPRVRKALSRAIDADALIAAQHGDGLPIGSPITGLEPGYADLTAVNAYDPDSARELLAEAGQQNLSLSLTAPNMYDTAALDLITSQLKEVGVAVKVKSVDYTVWLEEVYTNHDYQLSYVDQAQARDFANYTDPDYYLGYDSTRVQDLYARAIAEPDPSKRDRLIAEAAAQVAADAPAKWLYNYTPTNVISSHVSGFPKTNTNSRINLEGVHVSSS